MALLRDVGDLFGHDSGGRVGDPVAEDNGSSVSECRRADLFRGGVSGGPTKHLYVAEPHAQGALSAGAQVGVESLRLSAPATQLGRNIVVGCGGQQGQLFVESVSAERPEVHGAERLPVPDGRGCARARELERQRLSEAVQGVEEQLGVGSAVSSNGLPIAIRTLSLNVALLVLKLLHAGTSRSSYAQRGQYDARRRDTQSAHSTSAPVRHIRFIRADVVGHPRADETNPFHSSRGERPLRADETHSFHSSRGGRPPRRG